MVEGTDSETVIKVLENISENKRNVVEGVTLDMASSMRKIVICCFPKANRVIDRFHVQKLAYSLTHSLRMICSKNTDKGVAYTKMARWFNDVTESGFKSFNAISATFYSHYPEILNLGFMRVITRARFKDAMVKHPDGAAQFELLYRDKKKYL